MSSYRHQKVLRVPLSKINVEQLKDRAMKILKEKDIRPIFEDDIQEILEDSMPEYFNYSTVGMFQFAPTLEYYIDYVLTNEYDSFFGDFGRQRDLYDSEKNKYREKFKIIDPNINMDDVRLIEYCWYDAVEAPNYYNSKIDDFYDEV